MGSLKAALGCDIMCIEDVLSVDSVRQNSQGNEATYQDASGDSTTVSGRQLLG